MFTENPRRLILGNWASARNCLVNSWACLEGVFLVARSGNKGASPLILPTPGIPERSLFGFTKQFQRGSSRKPRRKKRARVTLLPNPALLARSHPRASGGKRREAGERKR